MCHELKNGRQWVILWARKGVFCVIISVGMSALWRFIL